MRRIGIGLLCLLTAVALGSATTAFGKDADKEMCVPMGTIVLEPPAGVEAQRPPAEFPHAAHFAADDCKTCHHQWGGKGKIVSCTTSGCHDLTESPKTDDFYENIRYYKRAFHTQCIGCHKENKERNMKLVLSNRSLEGTLPATGPTGCTECHLQY